MGGDECPECGSVGVGEGGKRRRVHKRMGLARRWGNVAALLMFVMMGVVEYGDYQGQLWVDDLAKVLGVDLDEDYRVNYEGGIRWIGNKEMIHVNSEWLYRLLEGRSWLGEGALNVISSRWLEYGLMSVEGGEFVKRGIDFSGEVVWDCGGGVPRIYKV